MGTLIPLPDLTPDIQGLYPVPERYPYPRYPLGDLTPDIQDLMFCQKEGGDHDTP